MRPLQDIARAWSGSLNLKDSPTFVPDPGTDFPLVIADVSISPHTLTPPILRFSLLLPCFSREARPGHVGQALVQERPFTTRNPCSSDFRRFRSRDSSTRRGLG